MTQHTGLRGIPSRNPSLTESLAVDQNRALIRFVRTVGERVWVRGAGILCLALVLLTVAMPRKTSLPYDWVGAVTVTVVILAAAIISAGIPAVRRFLNARSTPWLVGSLGVLAAIAVGYGSYYNTTWDSKLVELISQRPGSDATKYWQEYMSRYPNNDVLLALMRGVEAARHYIGVSFSTGILIVNTAAFALTITGVYMLARMLISRSAGVIGIMLAIVLLGFSPWMAVPYTDVPVMWVPVWAIVIIARCRTASRITSIALPAFGAGVIIAFGYCMKVTPIVGLPAAVLWAAWCAWSRRTEYSRPALWCWIVVVGLFLGTAGGLVLTKQLVSISADRPKITPGVSASPWTYIAAGLRGQDDRYGVRVYGGYDHEVNASTWGKSTQDQTSRSKKIITEELSRRGIAKTAWFEVNKLDYNWGDGMFYAYGEGTDQSQQAVHKDAWSQWVSSWNNPNGDHYSLRATWTQGIWWLALIMCGGWLLRGRATPEMILLIFTILGIAAFTLLFQGRSRYLIGHVPVILAMAGGGFTYLRASKQE